MLKYRRIKANILKTTGTTFSLVKKLLNREKRKVQNTVVLIHPNSKNKRNKIWPCGTRSFNKKAVGTQMVIQNIQSELFNTVKVKIFPKENISPSSLPILSIFHT